MNIRDIAGYLEVLPRFRQVINTVKVMSDEDIKRSKYSSLLMMLKEEDIGDDCIKGGVLDTELIYKGVVEGYIDFDVSNGTMNIGVNNKVRVDIVSYRRIRDGVILTPYKSDIEYTPTCLDGYIIKLKDRVKGGYIKLEYSALILKDGIRSSVIYEYSTEDIGLTLNPNIKDIYLMR